MAYCWIILSVDTPYDRKFVVGRSVQPQQAYCRIWHPWWRHQMETFSALLALYAGNSPVTGEFTAQRPVIWSFGVFFDLRRNKPLSKHLWGWWFETPPHPLWRHCNAFPSLSINQLQTVTSIKVNCLNQSSNIGILIWFKHKLGYLPQLK